MARDQRRADLRGTGVGDRREPRTDFSDITVAVLGGLVMDVFVRTPQLPEWGQAVQAERLEIHPGGKGLNQAIAASRLGARVCAIGAVGQDAFGDQILQELVANRVDVAGVSIIAKATTPVTLVFSRPGGDASFVGWKNSAGVPVDAALIEAQSSLIRFSDVLLSTLEVSPEAVSAALRIAKSGGATTVLNPAPPLERPNYQLADLPLDQVEILVPNEWEARELAGKRGAAKYSVREVASFLGSLGAKRVCITRAHNGCSFLKGRTFREYDAYETEADDTTGASDAFCATLALHLRGGYETEEAIHQAQAAGAWAVTKQGAGRHMPTIDQLNTHRDYLEGLKS